LPGEPLMSTLAGPVKTDPALESRITFVRARIAAAERRAGRAPGGVSLVAVVKTQRPDAIAAAVALGLHELGENRVQEAEIHQRDVPRGAARWHMIGHLQRNKVNKALQLFDCVHGVDDFGLGETIARRAAASGRVMPVLVEVNVSGEASKFGAEPEALPELLERLAQLDGLELRGLMTVGAPVARAEDARGGFALLRGLRDDGERRLGRPLPDLSMGMSGDFEVAIEEGATLVRVGTALFGERLPQGGET
jgi:pyridoxal phosphate enzyme (YggS family)